ncbi:proteasome activator complex subunit 3 [Cavenderia fasciculata]|uniref:Proteasome activator complex subunit 3 n=1 Tax=Cavenderia fasciculata TaxID=261658 RepID=F4Q6S9_CACFS|nr:proteasome activator complex subunit 3 [Cavenderia fasciculata]EGG16589.1 proteasome activator complex subunit 3 [Cavenderia fasciculata]|eukprot:XP_004354989.1 proteasome activator complex subunit 3 [Cavenderia fasciculata]
MSKKVELKLDERLIEFKQSLYVKMLEHLTVTIPARIEEFQKLSGPYKGQEDLYSLNKDIDMKEKKRKTMEISEMDSIPLEELVKTNTTIFEIHRTFKKHYIELIDTFSVIRSWINLNIPKIEDGNNFGVDIQEDVLQQVSKLEEAYTSLLDQSENYFLNRASTVKKALKHREIDAYKYAIIQQDEKELIRFHFSYFDLASNYATTYSLIIKNFQKVEQPRPTNQGTNIY